MRVCLINDCTDFIGAAPCCLDCEGRDRCKDRCGRKDSGSCASVMDEKEFAEKVRRNDRKRGNGGMDRETGTVQG